MLLKRRAARELLPEATFSETRAWFDSRKALRAGSGPRFGIAAGMNLVVIQVESLQAPMVDFQINGQPVMPNLKRLQATGVSFSQVFDQTDEGRTSDAEWLGLTSLLPEQHGAAAFVDAAGARYAGLSNTVSCGVRTVILESPRHASQLRVPREFLRRGFCARRENRLGPQRSRFPPANGSEVEG
ncbi:MAG: hypothetical protein EXQ50_06090 [Acidobacteria bacterium]|nr:hypothetical protein [Acidobacteriota bacterium]MSO61643.1 hypothetical protein [Acidobacteriota bacterium]